MPRFSPTEDQIKLMELILQSLRDSIESWKPLDKDKTKDRLKYYTHAIDEVARSILASPNSVFICDFDVSDSLLVPVLERRLERIGYSKKVISHYVNRHLRTSGTIDGGLLDMMLLAVDKTVHRQLRQQEIHPESVLV